MYKEFELMRKSSFNTPDTLFHFACPSCMSVSEMMQEKKVRAREGKRTRKIVRWREKQRETVIGWEVGGRRGKEEKDTGDGK